MGAGGAAALLAAAALAGCGAGDGGSTAADATAPAPPVPAPAAFDPTRTRLTVLSHEDEGGRFEAFFVAAPSPSALDQAVDCVRFYLGNSGNRSVACWAYPSQRSLAFARVRPATGVQTRRCWSARAEVAI